MRGALATVVVSFTLTGCSGVCLSEGRQPDVCLSGVLLSECTEWTRDEFQGASWQFLPGCPFEYNVLCDVQTFAKTELDCIR